MGLCNIKIMRDGRSIEEEAVRKGMEKMEKKVVGIMLVIKWVKRCGIVDIVKNFGNLQELHIVGVSVVL